MKEVHIVHLSYGPEADNSLFYSGLDYTPYFSNNEEAEKTAKSLEGEFYGGAVVESAYVYTVRVKQ